MAEYPRDLDTWLMIAGPDARSDAETILDKVGRPGWICGTAGDLIAVGVALWRQPPRVIPSLTPVQGLALGTQLFDAELLPDRFDLTDTDKLAQRARHKVTAVAHNDDDSPFDTLRQRAAFAAVRQLGGARAVGLPAWMETALGDTHNWTACDDIIGRVELACRGTAPGRRWCYVYQLGFITFESA
jgi:hypothetical protein